MLFCYVTGSIDSLVVKFADGGPKKRQQTQQNHGRVNYLNKQGKKFVHSMMVTLTSNNQCP